MLYSNHMPDEALVSHSAIIQCRRGAAGPLSESDYVYQWRLTRHLFLSVTFPQRCLQDSIPGGSTPMNHDFSECHPVNIRVWHHSRLDQSLDSHVVTSPDTENKISVIIVIGVFIVIEVIHSHYNGPRRNCWLILYHINNLISLFIAGSFSSDNGRCEVAHEPPVRCGLLLSQGGPGGQPKRGGRGAQQTTGDGGRYEKD